MYCEHFNVLSFSDMAALLEAPADVRTGDNLHKEGDIGEVIQLKEAKFNFQFKNAILDKENIEVVRKYSSFPEKDIIKHDIAKKHKTENNNKHKSDLDGRTEGSITRPMTENSDHNGWEEGKRDIQTPMSVKVDRKPLLRARRASSEYGRSTIHRQPIIGPGPNRFDGMPMGVTYDHRGYPSVQGKFSRMPSKLIRLATVTMSAR